MDNSEAQKILREQLARVSANSYSELTLLVERQYIETHKLCAASGKTYQVEIRYFWDDQPGDAIRVVGSVDDGGIRAFLPLTDSVLIARKQM